MPGIPECHTGRLPCKALETVKNVRIKNAVTGKRIIMRRFRTSIVLIFLTLLLSCVSSLAQTQPAMSQDACRGYQQLDAEMNKVYKRILNEYRVKPVFIQKFKTAQRSWLRFRDSHLNSLYPEQNKTREYGTVYSMCQCAVLEELTKQRTEQLQKWIAGVEEGDVCAGSIKLKR